MLILLDIDGTTIHSYMDNPDRDFHRWHVLPGRTERLAALLAAGHQVALVSNQAGVAFGLVSEAEVAQKIAQVLAALGLPASTRVYVCFAHPGATIARYRDAAELARRKPSGAMIREAMADAGIGAADVLFVGDRPEDEQAAADAGVAFRWADAFFGGA